MTLPNTGKFAKVYQMTDPDGNLLYCVMVHFDSTFTGPVFTSQNKLEAVKRAKWITDDLQSVGQ